MIRLRRLAIVLIAIGLVTSAIYGTGAFNSLTASRDANVHVAGDKAGYLSLQPGATNGQYVTYTNGKLQLRLDGAVTGEDAPRGEGVNRDARTELNDVFTITNQGAQSVAVWLKDTDKHIDFQRADSGSLEGKDTAVRLTPGDTVHVGLTIDTTNTDADQLDTQLIINADSDVEGGSTESLSAEDTTENTSSSNPSSPSNNNDGSNNKYRNCNKYDVLCHGDNALTWGGEKKSEVEDAADKEIDKFKDDPGEYVKELNPWRDDYRATRPEREKLIQTLRDSIDAVFDFLDSHPGIERMLVASNPGAATLAGWVDLNPEKATSLALGLLLGEAGLPNGLHKVPESDSAYYVVGWLAPGLIPWVNLAPDVRDLGNSALTLNLTGTVLNSFAVGSNFAHLKGFGYGDVMKVGGFLGKWTADVASKSAKASALKAMSKTVLPVMSSGKVPRTKLIEAEMSVTIMDVLSDGAASTLVKNDVPMDTIVEYAQKGELKQVAEVTENTGLPAVRTIEKSDLELTEWATLANQGHKPSSVASLIDNGLSPDKIRTAAWTKEVDLTKAEELRKADDVTIYNVRTLIDEGADFKRANKAHNEGVPVEHIEYYAKNGNDLDVVVKLNEKLDPEFVKDMYKIKNTGRINKKNAKKSVVTSGNIYIVANNYCTWQSQQHVDDDWKHKDSCEILPTQSRNTTAPTNTTN